MRRVNHEGIRELKRMESVERSVYTDSAGHPTIGVGHKLTAHERKSGLLMIDGRAVAWAMGLTDEQVVGLLRADLDEAEKTVEECVLVPLSDNQFAALVCLCFNIGSWAFRKSSVVRVLNQGLYHLVPGMMRLWNKVTVDGVKVISKGLVNRREAEVRLWASQ